MFSDRPSREALGRRFSRGVYFGLAGLTVAVALQVSRGGFTVAQSIGVGAGVGVLVLFFVLGRSLQRN